MSGVSTSIRVEVVQTPDGPSTLHTIECGACVAGEVDGGCASHGGGCDVAHYGCRPAGPEACGECGGSGERREEGCGCSECARALWAWKRTNLQPAEWLRQALAAHDYAHEAWLACAPSEVERCKRLRAAKDAARDEVLAAAEAWRDDEQRPGLLVPAQEVRA